MTEKKYDSLHRFMLERAGVRGVWVRLEHSWQAIQSRSSYPSGILHRLGETCTAAALFTGHIKVEGRLGVQLRGTGALRTLFAECTSEGTLRGIATFEEPVPLALTPRAFGDGSLMAITIETLAPGAREPVRYQGIVGLDADSLADAFENYFLQSEQLPTRILLAATETHTAGLLLQLLPRKIHDEDAWQRVSALFETLENDELLNTGHETLLWRLFHEENVQLLDHKGLEFGCSCSRSRVEDVMRSLGTDEAMASLEEDLATVHCDFCGQAYVFTRKNIEDLFVIPAASAPGSGLLQ
ncbi:MAG: Hsp33 family molecular chaperone HslO [Arenimonas sp.]